ncbi:chaperonin Cpn60/TCP-1 family [Russula ochroleuca]|uniref:Chaperonin Cpn60/TCP-1 family n=1 Tax=Russula ochroleuca TaxID=152965 RepID=A0A9P5N4P5_9AGAM|nr:chaperonin Cpn60/TCP-1 family [Russula ochroleuca]
MIAVKNLESIADTIEYSKTHTESLLKTAMTTLGSKIVSKEHEQFAQIAVDAVLQVADLECKDVLFDLIKVDGKVGGSLADTQLIKGVLIDKDMSHPQMPSKVEDARIATHLQNINSIFRGSKLQNYEKEKFADMIKRVKDSDANLVICQWGFDDEANHQLMQNDLPAVRWVGGPEIETEGRIVPRFEYLTPEKLGKAGIVCDVTFGTTRDRMMVIEECANTPAPNKMIVDESKRALHDAICAVRNLIKDNRVVYGGGAADISSSLAVQKAADGIPSIEQYAMRAFASALDSVPLALVETADFRRLRRSRRRMTRRWALAAMGEGTTKQFVYDPLISKRQQYLLATQVYDVIISGQAE